MSQVFSSDNFLSLRNRNWIQSVARALNFRIAAQCFESSHKQKANWYRFWSCLSPGTRTQFAPTCNAPGYLRVCSYPRHRRNKMTSALQQTRQRQAHLDEKQLVGIRAAIRGHVCLKGSPGYDEARTIWNAMIDRYPDVVIRCAETADIIQAVRFANEHDLAIAVRGGGHNIAGNAVGDGGLLIDLSPMKVVKVDPQSRTTSVGPGATLADVDKETQAFALALPTGINSTTGIAGLTLGGGFGWLTRPFGMTIDNLVSVDVVTAKGELVRASANQNEDLFWAIRGGGGNFGVVTNFEFKLHPVGPQVFSGLIVHPFENAKQLLNGYREVVWNAAAELTGWDVMRKAHPLPFIPAEWHGREVLVFAACYSGEMAAGEKASAPLRRLGKSIADVLGPHPFVGWQAAF